MAIAAPFPAARAARPTRPATRRAVASSTRRSSAARPSGPRPSTPRPASRGVVLTRRGRIVVGALSVLFLLVVVTLSGRFTADAGTSAADQGRATGVVVVQSGESLWQIAQSIAPDVDPRETITRIRELNGLGDAPVLPGQSIIVPVVGAAAA